MRNKVTKELVADAQMMNRAITGYQLMILDEPKQLKRHFMLTPHQIETWEYIAEVINKNGGNNFIDWYLAKYG